MLSSRLNITLLTKLGDAFIIFIIALFGAISPIAGEVNTPTLFVFWIWLTLYTVWTIATAYLERRRQENNWKTFLVKIAVAWLIAITIALVVRSFIFGSPPPPFGFLIWMVIEGLLYLLLWRVVLKGLIGIFRGDSVFLRAVTVAGIAICVLGTLLVGGLYIRTLSVTQDAIRPVDAVSQPTVAIVLGAYVWWDGTPSTTLIHRVEKAAELYHAGKVNRLLLSGDGRTESYNETKAMQSIALELNVPQDALILDYYGLRTYDTCARAHDLFDVTEAVLVTQAFQLPRALMLCEHHNIVVTGVPVDEEPTAIRQQAKNLVREILAITLAYVDQIILKPAPVLHNDVSY